MDKPHKREKVKEQAKQGQAEHIFKQHNISAAQTPLAAYLGGQRMKACLGKLEAGRLRRHVRLGLAKHTQTHGLIIPRHACCCENIIPSLTHNADKNNRALSVREE